MYRDKIDSCYLLIGCPDFTDNPDIFCRYPKLHSVDFFLNPTTDRQIHRTLSLDSWSIFILPRPWPLPERTHRGQMQMNGTRKKRRYRHINGIQLVRFVVWCTVLGFCDQDYRHCPLVVGNYLPPPFEASASCHHGTVAQHTLWTGLWRLRNSSSEAHL